MGGKQLSIIIPTHNRKDTVKTNLEKLAKQGYPPENFEVVVADGGSTDGIGELLASLKDSLPYALKYYRQGNRGPGPNRNLGLRHAEGDIVLFINDDVFPSPTMLQEHMSFHERYPQENIAVLGRVVQAPEVKTTPFMKFFVPFAYHLMEGKSELDYRFFWTCNLSLKRKFLLENGMFDESMSCAAHEDIELGYRLEHRGLRILYNREALGYHHHFQTFEAECKRQRMMGYYFFFLRETIRDPKLYEMYPVVYWGFPTRVLVRKLARHIARLMLFNSLTVPYFFKPFVQRIETNPKLAPLARPFYWKILAYYARKGIAEGLKSRPRA